MASKLVSLFIIIVCFNAIFATKHITLNIGRYNPDQDPTKPAPNPYKIFEFSPKKGKKLHRAVLGPVVIFEDLSLIWYIVSLHLETLYLVPQLAKLILTDGTNETILFYRWDKHGFVTETEENHASYKHFLVNNALVSTTPYVDVKRQINFQAFDITTELIYEVPYTTVRPKTGFFLHLIIHANDSLVKSDEPILSFKGYRDGNEFKTLEASFETPKPTIFLVLEEGKWKEVNNQKFLDSSKNYHQESLKKQQLPTAPIPVVTPFSPPKPVDLTYTALQQPIRPPDSSLLDQIVVATPMERPSTPITFVPRTPPFPNSKVLDLNKITSSFTVDSKNSHEYEVLTVHPNEGISVFEIVESGYTLWNNRRSAKLIKVEMFLRNKLIVLLTIFFNRIGLRRIYFARNFGRLYLCSYQDFNQLFDSWKTGPNFDNTISFSTHMYNNLNLYNQYSMLHDGVQYTSPVPLQGYNLVRLIHGTHDVFQEQGENWTHVTMNFFSSTNVLVTVGVNKNGQQHEKYFDSKGVLVPMDYQTFTNTFFQFQSEIHHQANVLFDLKKEIRQSYIKQNRDLVYIVPLSGYYVRIVNYGKYTLWKSINDRCTSIQFHFDEHLKSIVLVKLFISTADSTNTICFRFVGSTVFRVESELEFSTLVEKYFHNYKNDNHRIMIEASQSDDPSTNYEMQILDLLNYDHTVPQYSSFDEYVLKTTFIPNNGRRFQQVNYGNQILWVSNLSNGFCLKLSVYFHAGSVKLLKLFSYLNGSENIEFILFNEDFVESISEDEFKANILSLRAAFESNVIPVDDVTILDLTDAANYNPLTTRKEKLVTITYHNHKGYFGILCFGPEIMWMGSSTDLATHVTVYYYEYRPIVAQLAITPGRGFMKSISNFNRAWHTLSSNGFENLLSHIRDFEYLRTAFTLPSLSESTDFDDDTHINGNLIIRSFFSKTKLMASVFFDRARVYCPNLYRYIHSMYLCYHDSLPKLLAFREYSIYGYSFDHHLIFRNGWRPVPYSKFLQFFQYYKHTLPKNSVRPTQFDYDISTDDPRVIVSKMDDRVTCYKYRVTDTQLSLRTLSTQGTLIWTAPKHINLRSLFVYMKDDIALLARLEEEDHTQFVEEVFLRLEGDQWREIDYNVFTAEYNDLLGQLPSPVPTSSPISIQHPVEPSETTEVSQPLGPLDQQEMDISEPPSSSETLVPEDTSDIVSTPPEEPKPSTPEKETAENVSRLELLEPFDKERFTFGKGHHALCVPFDDVETRRNSPITEISVGNAVVWTSTEPNGSCVRVRSFLKDGSPVLLQIIKKVSKKQRKFEFIVMDDGIWTVCSEEVFNSTLSSLVQHYRSKSSGS
ncbi:polymorphic antigen precursor, putative [Theileria annulata]|uniref:Polymorphic antigen, putative n=1 Tax=Theileria annulata TaxID=5874 RepID=Q4UAU1_THEAN|nr:polymorphic antigen precursor, putative [Theileria annulata]CAI76060.1 polymorphic antigen precursor, putative [Theileria annulata]|eukprot:XP_955536.1 polymorphic antigen precursor, putative [Theileria annulata]